MIINTRYYGMKMVLIISYNDYNDNKDYGLE